jgi:hypothetical protein
MHKVNLLPDMQATAEAILADLNTQIRARRYELKLGSQRITEALGITHPGMVTRMERGIRVPMLLHFLAIVDELGLKVQLVPKEQSGD